MKKIIIKLIWVLKSKFKKLKLTKNKKINKIIKKHIKNGIFLINKINIFKNFSKLTN